jgi:hypothetical protein
MAESPEEYKARCQMIDDITNQNYALKDAMDEYRSMA